MRAIFPLFPSKQLCIEGKMENPLPPLPNKERKRYRVASKQRRTRETGSTNRNYTTLHYTTLLHSYTPLHFHTYPLLQKDKLIVRIDKLQYCKARRIPQGVYCDTRPFLSEKRARPKNAPCPKPSTKREGMFGYPPIGLTMSTPP